MSALNFFQETHGSETQWLPRLEVINFAENFHRYKQKQLTSQSDTQPIHNHEELRKGLDHKHTFGVNLGIGF